MAYASVQDLIDRFGERTMIQLSDRTHRPQTAIDADVVGHAIADAEALVDGYLAKAISLPIAEVPASLTRITADIARYYLLGEAADKDGAAARAHDQALTWLRDVSRGVVVLVQPSTDTPAPAVAGGVRVVAGDRVLSRDSLRGM